MTGFRSTDATGPWSRRAFLAGAGALVTFVVGCRSDGDGASDAAQGTQGRSTGDTAGRDAPRSTDDVRGVDTPYGTVDVPVAPARVLATYTTGVDYALALDLPLIAGGAKQGTLGQQFASYQTDARLDGVTPVDFWPEPNFEQLAAQQPDLIIDDTPYNAEWYRILEDIAPTLNFSEASATEEPGVIGWQQALRYLATTLDAHDEAESFIERYDARFAEVKRDVAATGVAGQRVIVTTPYGADLYVQTGPVLPLPKLFGDLGFRYPPELESTDPDGTGEIVLPPEQFELLDSDWLVVLVYSTADGDVDTSLIEQISDSALWQRLPAVRAGRVVEMDSDLNFASPGTAMALLDVIERSMLGGD